MSPRTAILLAAGAVASPLTGCAIGDPYNTQRPPTSTAASSAQPTDAPPPRAYVARDPAPPAPTRLPATARDAAVAFAGQWANWTPRTTRRQYRRMAALATPAFARVLAQTAAANNQAAAPDGAGSRGRVVGADTGGRGPRRTVVVVTAEVPTGAGQGGPTLYRVYVGVVERQRAGWAVATWSQKT
jgi:hypothetical protein